MRCCKRKLEVFIYILLLLSAGIYTPDAGADGITVSKTAAFLGEDGYQIAADFKVTLPPSVADALVRGVTLNFISNLTLTRSRWYWFDATVIQDEQQSRLSYNALTQQYRISRGSLYQAFSSLQSALRVLGHQDSSPVSIPTLVGSNGYVAKMLKGETKFTAFAQMRLDTSMLPKPLQVDALTSSEWNLESENFSWTVNPKLSPGTEAKP